MGCNRFPFDFMYSGTQDGAWKDGKAVVLGLGFDGKGAQSVELSLMAKQTLGNTTWGMVGHAWKFFQFSADVLQLILMTPYLVAFENSNVMTIPLSSSALLILCQS